MGYFLLFLVLMGTFLLLLLLYSMLRIAHLSDVQAGYEEASFLQDELHEHKTA